MRRKPKRVKYRNLHARGSTIVYERILDIGTEKRRVKCHLGVADWDEAAAIRDALEVKLGVGSGLLRVECPSFAEAAAECLKELTHLAPTTREDREAMLADVGPLVGRFGAMRTDAICRVHLLDCPRVKSHCRPTVRRCALRSAPVRRPRSAPVRPRSPARAIVRPRGYREATSEGSPGVNVERARIARR